MRFLTGLATHNDRAWFTPRKQIYQDEIVAPLQALVTDVGAALHKAKIPLGGDPKRSVFRIYRDVRFSADKSPYKTNAGAYLSREDRSVPGGLYIHIQPKQSFVAAGFYELDKALLERWREAMAADPKAFQTVLRALERGGLTLYEHDDALKRMPRGFESMSTSPIAKYFRERSFIMSERLSDSELARPRLVTRVADLAKRAKPLFAYGSAL